MRTIRKYHLEMTDEPGVINNVEIPAGSVPLHVHEQNGLIYVWAEVDTDRRPVKYRYCLFGTDDEITAPSDTLYLGTVHISLMPMSDSTRVYHVFMSGRIW